MKSNYKIFILIAALWLAACGPKHIISTEPVRHDPGYELFSKAEKLFQVKSYDKALETYNAYLVRFRDGSFVDAALMKTGTIFATIGKNAEARNIYKRLLAEYPESLFIPDARVEILVTFYNEGQYAKVIKKAGDVLKETVSRGHIIRIYDLLGDVYTTIGSPKDAVHFYIKAYCQSKDLQKDKIIIKLKEPFSKLDTAAISSILESLEDQPRGSFMFYMGISKFEEEKFGDALNLLSAFVKEFPKHDDVRQAKLLLEELYKKSVYSRYAIGCLLPLSGPYKIYGQRALQGVELALNQFSSQSANPALKIIVKDTESDPDKAASAVRELYGQHVAAIIGPIIADEPAAIEAQDRGIPIITLTQKDNITDIGDYVFRNFITPKMQVQSLVSCAIEELGLSRFAILYPDENYGITFMNLFWDEIIAYGGKVVGIESYKLEQTDFADSIKKLVGLYYEVPENLNNETGQTIEEVFEPIADFDTFHADSIINFEDFYFDVSVDLQDAMQVIADTEADNNEEPEPIVDFDAIFIPDAPNKAGLIVPQLPFYDVGDVYLLGTNLWHSDSLVEMARRYIQGAIMPDGFFAESTSMHVKNFVRLFENTYGKRPGFIEAVTYDTAMIMFQTISKPAIFYRSGIKDELMNLNNYQGVTGLTSFDHNGEVIKKPHLLRIKGKKFVELEYD